MQDFQIVWRGIVHDSQGYARASREYLLGLDRLGLDIKIDPLNFGTSPVMLEHNQASRIRELIAKPLATDKKRILIYHSQPYGIDCNHEREVNGFDKVIINTVWETTKVPNNWFPYINYADAVVVPSKQNVIALRHSGVDVPIFLVPHGANIETYKPSNDSLELAEAIGKFNFLSVFQWQHRKAPEVLLEAFYKEFTSQDNVSLIIKSYWGNDVKKSDQRTVRNAISHFKHKLGVQDGAPIYFTGSRFNDDDMKKLYTLGSIYVLPTRGEGVGLPYMEAMSSGIPCIATGWGGQTDFIDNSNGYLIDFELQPTLSSIANGIAPNFFNLFTNEMNWAEPSVDSLRKIMRHAYENQEEVKEKGMKARITMESMTWDNSASIFRDALEEVMSK